MPNTEDYYYNHKAAVSGRKDHAEEPERKGWRSHFRNGKWSHSYRPIRNKERALPKETLGKHPEHKVVIHAFREAEKRYFDTPKGEVPTPHGSLDWLIEQYKQSDEWLLRNGEETQGQKNSRFERIKGSALGTEKFAKLTREAINDSLHAKLDAEEPSERLAGATLNNYVTTLRQVFEFAVRRNWIKENPTNGIVFTQPKEKHYEPPSDAEVKKFHDYHPVGTQARLMHDLARLTGAARVDLTYLGSNNIERFDDGKRLLTYKRSKTGTTARIPIDGELREVLAPVEHQEFFISKDISGGRNSASAAYSPDTIGNNFRKYRNAAGCTHTIHCLRSLFCINLVYRGLSRDEIMVQTGHETASQIDSYIEKRDKEMMALKQHRD